MEWYSNDGLWSGFGDVMFTSRREAEAAENVKSSPLLAFPAGARVLDLCCGPGLYLVPLAQLGYEVTGVDLNALMLERARAAVAASGVEVELVQADMIDFVRPGGFDAVVNMYASFGYFAEPEQNLQVLRNAHESLAPGGQLLVELFGKEFLAPRLAPQVIDRPEGTVFVRSTILDGWTRMRTDWTLVSDEVARTASLTSFVYSAAELRALFEQAEFRDVACFGGFDGRAYDNHSKKLIVRGTRA